MKGKELVFLTREILGPSIFFRVREMRVYKEKGAYGTVGAD